MLNIAMNIFVQNVVSSLFDQFPGWIVSVGVPLALTLVFGEVIPKSIAISNNAKIAQFVAPVVYFAKRLLGPFRSLISKVTSFVSHVLFFFLRKEKEISSSEIKEALRSSIEFGLLQEDEAKLLRGYLNLEEFSVKEIMRPRQHMLYFDVEDPLTDLMNLFVDEECSKIPICKMDKDEVLGVLSAEQFFVFKDRIHSPKDLEPILKEPFYVPESITAKQLLSQFDEKEESMAIVIDEYGSISGLITKEDLVEIVFGQIEDKRDVKDLYVKSSPNVIIADGKLELVEFEEIFGFTLDNPSDMATLGGWLMQQLEDIPKNGAKYHTKDFLFYVLAAAPNKIDRIYVRKLHHRQKEGKV
jgi:CBS domain containing-hemolysin-like protein